MNHFRYRDGALHCEAVPLATIAEAVGTPLYCYSTATLSHHYTVFAEAFAGLPTTVCYSIKANANLAVVRTLADLGAGADVVSEGELLRALAAGVPASRIVFSGVGKTRTEMAAALDAAIHQFNVESESELRALSEVAAAKGTVAPVAMRVNPHVDAQTHDKIATGRKGDKFGIDWGRSREIYALAATLPGIEIAGVDVHIGSQLTDLAPFAAAYGRVAELVGTLRADGHRIRRLDLGGGLGIPYDQEEPPDPVQYATMTKEVVRHLGCELILEPGRMLVGNAGVMVARVLYLKQGGGTGFVVLDAAMNDLLRPALYQAYHAVEPVIEADAEAVRRPIDIVGPVCETGDVFARQRMMPPLGEGDLVVFRTAGAYGAVMASSYNSRLAVPEVLVKGADFAVVRPRPGYDDLLALDRMPDWLSEADTRGVSVRGTV